MQSRGCVYVWHKIEGEGYLESAGERKRNSYWGLRSTKYIIILNKNAIINSPLVQWNRHNDLEKRDEVGFRLVFFFFKDFLLSRDCRAQGPGERAGVSKHTLLISPLTRGLCV